MIEIIRRSKLWCSQPPVCWSANGTLPHWAASQCNNSYCPALTTSLSQRNLEKWVPGVDGGNVRDWIHCLSTQLLGLCHCHHISLILDLTRVNPTAAVIRFPVLLCRRAVEVEKHSQSWGPELGGPFWLLQVGQVVTRRWHPSPGDTMAHAGHGASPYLRTFSFLFFP